MSDKKIKIGNETYDIPTNQAIGVTNAIVLTWEKLGRPKTPFSETGKKLMEVIIATWRDTFPKESKDWLDMRKEYQKEELTTKEQVHRKTGRSLASYPYYIFQVMKKVFPKIKLADRKTAIKMVKHYPMFRMCNRV
jgi:hypothetical protein